MKRIGEHRWLLGVRRMEVRSLMTRRVVTVGMDDRLGRVRELFAEHGFHHLLVVERQKVVGVLSDRDLFKNLSPFIGKPLAERSQDQATLKRRVHQIMTRKLIAVPADASAEQAAVLMLEHNVSCLPVISPEQRPLGIVTARDLLRWAVGKLSPCSEREARAAPAEAPTGRSESLAAAADSAPASIETWRDRVARLIDEIEGDPAARQGRSDRPESAIATLARAVLLLLERAEGIDERTAEEQRELAHPVV
jgi:acetoin utilization protein AcuB